MPNALELFSEADKAGNTLRAVEEGSSAARLFEEDAFESEKFDAFKRATSGDIGKIKTEAELAEHFAAEATEVPPELTALINEFKDSDGILGGYLTDVSTRGGNLQHLKTNISSVLRIAKRGPKDPTEMGNFILRMGPLMEKDPKIFRAVLDEFLESGGVAGVEGLLQGDRELIEMIAEAAPVLSEGGTVEAAGSGLRNIANCAGIYGSELTKVKYDAAEEMLRANKTSKYFRGADPPITSMEELKNAATKKEPPFGLKSFSETSPGEALDEMKTVGDLKDDERFKAILRLSNLSKKTGKIAEELKALLREDESIFQSFKRLEREGNEGKILRKFSNAIKRIWNSRITTIILTYALWNLGNYIVCQFKDGKCKEAGADDVTLTNGTGKDAAVPDCEHMDRKASDGITNGEWAGICSDNIIHTRVAHGERILCSPPNPSPSYALNPEFNNCDMCIGYYYKEPSITQKILYFLDIGYLTKALIDDETKSYYFMINQCNTTADYEEKTEEEMYYDTVILATLCILLLGMPLIAWIFSIAPYLSFLSFYIWMIIGCFFQISLIYPIIKYKKIVERDSEDYKKKIMDLVKSPDFNSIDVNNELNTEQLTSIINTILTIGESEDDKKKKMVSMLSLWTIISAIFVSDLGIMGLKAGLSGEDDEDEILGGQRGGKRNILSKTLNKFNKFFIIFLLILAILINYFYNSNSLTMHQKNYIQEMKKERSRNNIQVKEENKNLSYESGIVFGGQFI